MAKKLVILIYSIFILLSINGQSSYHDYNISQIESLKQVFDTGCKSYSSERPISKKMIRWDKKMIHFLNDVYNKNLTLSEIQSRYAKISPKALSFDFSDITDLGGFRRYETPIYSEGNLKVEILLIAIDDLILYKKIRFETKRRTNCFDPPTFGISYYDVKYLEEKCLRLINFPMSTEKWPFISAEKPFFKHLSLLKAKGYRGFEIDSAKKLDDLIFFETTHYGFKNPLTLADFYKNNKVDSLVQLLYAPNHIVALYAMEALIALKNIKQATLSSDVLAKMELLKNSNIKIKWNSGDVIHSGTYKELNRSEKFIVDKYRKIE